MPFLGSQSSITSTAIVALVTSTGNGPCHIRIDFASTSTGPAVYLGSAAVTTAEFQLTTAAPPFTGQISVGETLYAISTAAVRLSVLKHYDW